MAINPNDAPEGFEAVHSPEWECTGYTFNSGRGCAKSDREHYRHDFIRADGLNVIFIPRTYGPIMATANFPYDSEGTPVEVLHA